MELKICKLFVALSVVIVLLFIQPTQPYSMGAPDQACGAMYPGHGFDPQDNDQIPLSFSVSPEGPIAPGQSVTIELKINEEEKGFKGYMIQARRFVGKNASENIEDIENFIKEPVGNFDTEESSYLTCGPGIHNTITHRNQKTKRIVSAKWVAPKDYEGEIYFRYTVVIEYAEYYVGVETSNIRITGSAVIPATTTTTSASTTSVNDSTYFPVVKENGKSEKNATEHDKTGGDDETDSTLLENSISDNSDDPQNNTTAKSSTSTSTR